MTATPADASARRMLRRSRRLWTVLAVIAAALAGAVVIVETTRYALGLPAWISAPSDMLALLAGGSQTGLAIGAGAALFAVACLWGALVPGRAGRRVLRGDRAPIVIDDAVLAGSLSRRAGRVAGVGAGQVHTQVTRRRADIRVTPSSGFAVAGSDVQREADDDLAALGLVPGLRARARVDASGVLS